MILGNANQRRQKISEDAVKKRAEDGLSRPQNRGQSFLEYSFGIAMAVLLMLGMIEAFIWAGSHQVKLLDRHDAVLIDTLGTCTHAKCALDHLKPTFFRPAGYRDSVSSNIYGDVQVRFNEYTN